MSGSAARAWRAIGVVLTGQVLAVPEDADWRAERVVAWLAGQGWTAERLVARRDESRARHTPWPDPLTGKVSEGLEYARYGALLAQVRARTGLDGLRPTIHRGAIRIGPEEARLLAEVPPHHVPR